jgi:hypothetical protein
MTWPLQDDDDRAALRNIVEQHGPERVARIAAALTDSGGIRGQPDKLDALLLLRMARLKLRQPQPTDHAAAREVAEQAKPAIAIESLVSKLLRDFKGERRHRWMQLAASTPEPSAEQIERDRRRKKTSSEHRALARMTDDVLPNAIDVYDAMIAEAKSPKEKQLLKRFGRARAEAAFEAAVRVGRTRLAPNAKSAAKIPRSLLDLIRGRRTVGRK